MSFTMRNLILALNNSLFIKRTGLAALQSCRCLSALPSPELEHHSEKRQSSDVVKSRKVTPPPNVRLMYPEFLPRLKPNMRNKLREQLERTDMMARRTVVDLPEFYVGSVLAVTTSDKHAQGKSNRFVGICVKRNCGGLSASFTLRNVIDHQGIEMRYMLYDPTIQQIQVLRLEKRLDEKLYYLRDADPKYSTFPLDMEPEILPEGSEVPINDIKVELKPRPWVQKWWLHDLKGVEGIDKQVRYRERARSKITIKPYLKYDLMGQYRRCIPEEQQNEIWSEVYSQLDQLHTMRKKMAKNRSFVFPKKSG